MSPKYVDYTSVYWRGLQEALVVLSLRHWISNSGLCSTVRASSGLQKSYLSPSSFWLMVKVLLSNCDFYTRLRFLHATSLIHECESTTVQGDGGTAKSKSVCLRVLTKYKIQGVSPAGKVLATQAQDPTLDPLHPCEDKQALCNNEHLRFQHRGCENRRSPVGHWLAHLPCQICSRLSERPHFKK